MILILIIGAFGGAGWLMLKRYERYLDAQMGPWITAEVESHGRRDGGVR
ncbi:MAG: hypothetical protein ABWY18_17730 [Tardiphaga sp.]